VSVYPGVDDEATFREFVASRQGALSRVAYLLTGDHHAAEDLVQSALIKTARHWRRVSTLASPEAYLRRAIYHEHVSAWRKHRGAELTVAETPEPPSAPDVADAAVRALVLRQALARLTPRQRAVLVLRYFEDLSEADTAAVLDCTVGTVKSQTHHALGRLRALAPELDGLIVETENVR
jgi:RNA polymerase sigma-70 factor (sigma-E family)